MRMAVRIGLAMLGCVACTSIAGAQQARLSPAALEVAALELDAGEAMWHDSDPAGGPIAIVISLPLQVAYVYRSGTLVGVSSVSTGKAGKETPTGTFEILQKKVFHRSNLYSNAPMPFMQRLTWDGIALHAGDNPGYPASHGCIRFPAEFAKKLYGLTDMGGTVLITDDVAVTPPGANVPRLVPPPSSFSFGSEPVIASRSRPARDPQPAPPARPREKPRAVAKAPAPVPVAPAPRILPQRPLAVAQVTPKRPAASATFPARAERAATAPRLAALGFEPVRR